MNVASNPAAKKAKVPAKIIELNSDSSDSELPLPSKLVDKLLQSQIPASFLSTQTTASSSSLRVTTGKCFSVSLIQTKLPIGMSWKPCTQMEIQESMAKSRKAAEAARQIAQEREEKTAEKKQEYERELARNRQRKYRKKKREEREAEPEDDVNEALMRGARGVVAQEGTQVQCDIASISRAGHEGWKKSRNGTQGETKVDKASRANWYHPFLWQQIE